MDTEQNNYTIDQVIESSFDFSQYPEEEKQNMIAETSSMIMEASLLRALTDAGEETQQAFQTMIEGNPTEEDMATFIKNHFPTFQDIVISEVQSFLNSDDRSDVAETIE